MFPRPDTVSIVACGPSALDCGAARAPGMVLAINGAIDHVRFDVALTMDGRFARNRWKALYGKQAFIRRSAWAHVVDVGGMPWDGLRVYECDREQTEFADNDRDVAWTLNGSNSGYNALNLAFNLMPRRVYLYGFDMDEPTHFFGEYPWVHEAGKNNRAKFELWRREMVHASGQFRRRRIEVYNTNRLSAIKAFPHGTPGT